MTFHIRDGLERADGKPLNAYDFEFALQRAIDPRVPDKVYTSILYDIQGAEELDAMAYQSSPPRNNEVETAFKNYGVNALDSRTLKITFKQPIGFWDYVASTWVTYPVDESEVAVDPDAWWKSAIRHNGNGPFRFDSIEQGKRIVLVANPNYWRGKQKLERVELEYNSDNAILLEAYRRNELDLIASVSTDQIASLTLDSTLSQDLTRYPSAWILAFGFNQARAPFDDIYVRIAFSQAFNREAFIREVRDGVGQVYTRWIPPGVPGAQPERDGVPNYDPKAAVKTLVDHGYAAPNSTTANLQVDCSKLGDITLSYYSTVLNNKRFQFLADNFESVFGCDITLDPQSTTPPSSPASSAPLIRSTGWIQDYPHPQNWLSVYWTCNGFARPLGYCNSALDAKLRVADQTRDWTTARALYQEAEEILVASVPAAIYSYGENIYLIKPWVQGAREHTSSSDSWVGEYGPVWDYTIDLTQVPASYPEK